MGKRNRNDFYYILARHEIKPTALKKPPAYNHFEIPETLANPYGLLGRAVLEQMKLAPA